jgi:hypothetical protein
VRLEGLSPDAEYAYEILDEARAIARGFRFRTDPGPEGRPIRLALTGDSGLGNDHQRALAGVIRGAEPDLFLHAGDLDYLGNVDRSVFEPYREVLGNVCMYAVPGNHDLDFTWRDFFVPPEENPEGTGTYYSFDWGCAHFVGLDTNIALDSESEQIRWLIQNLEEPRAPGIRWTVLFLHEPVYTVGAYAFDSTLQPPKVIPEIVDEYGVDLVLTAHDHNYQRTHPLRGGVPRDAWQDPEFIQPRGTVYLVSGGGGGHLYPEIPGSKDRLRVKMLLSVYHVTMLEIGADRISVDVLGEDGLPIDAFRIHREGSRPEFRFLRGDTDFNGRLEVTDAIEILRYLFLGGTIACPAVGDLEGEDGSLGIADGVSLLNFLFLGGPPPPAPFPECGPAPLEEDPYCVRAGCP